MNNYNIYSNLYDFQEFEEPILNDNFNYKNKTNINLFIDKLFINIIDKFKDSNPKDFIFIFIIIFIAVYKYIILKKNDPFKLFRVIFSNEILGTFWIFTFLFCLYVFFILPDNHPNFHFIKQRTSDALKCYLIAVFAFYDLPLPAFWLILFYNIFFIKGSFYDL